MAYKPVDRSFTEDYLNKQYEAMRWLYDQGLTVEQIQTFHWGNVQEAEKMIRVSKPMVTIRLDRKSDQVDRNAGVRDVLIPLSGSKYEWFFMGSRIYCHWVFLREKPRTGDPASCGSPKTRMAIT